MTVATTVTKVTSTGNGVTVAFPYTFKCYTNTDLEVYLDGVLKTLTTHYTVTLADNYVGGTVTFLSAPANGVKVLIRRIAPQTQGSTILIEDELPSNLIETALDKTVMLVQQLYESLSRALVLSPTSTSTASLVIPDPVANKGLKWNATADALINTTGDPDATATDAAAAAASAAAASASATSASGYATAASASATSASGSASTATTQAGIATTQAGNAATSASSAASAAQTIYDATNVGAVLDFTGSSAPTKTLLAYGQAVSRTTYATYFALVGTTYGAGDGSTTFNMPDLRGRTAIGKDNMGGSAASRVTSSSTNGANSTTLGGAGGAETHTLTTAQLPDYAAGASNARAVTSGAGGLSTGAGTGFASGSSSIALTNGSGSAHSNTQPWMALNKCVYVGV